MENIRIGTMAGGFNSPEVINQIKKYGFECFELNFGELSSETELIELSKKVKESLGSDDIQISCVGTYGNPLIDENSVTSWKTLIKTAKYFNTDLVVGFAGALDTQPLEESLPKFKEVFSELVKMAEDNGLKIAFENCAMGGRWDSVRRNIAINHNAWELMFNEVKSENIGLEWEPCHQMVQLIDPIAQLRKWAKKVFHLHGKDATIAHDIIREHGILGGHDWCWHRTPGFGDTNWSDIITILRMNGYKGNIDIEGWHDPVYRDELEYTGQVNGLNYLKERRGGDYIPNPK